jgi:hypothetical protein
VVAIDMLEPQALEGALLIGELSLAGSLRSVTA